MGPANTGVLHCRRLMFNLSRFVRRGECKVMVNQQKALFLEDLKRTLHFDFSCDPIQGCRNPHTLSRAQTLHTAAMPALMGEAEAETRGFGSATGFSNLHRVSFTSLRPSPTSAEFKTAFLSSFCSPFLSSSLILCNHLQPQQ